MELRLGKMSSKEVAAWLGVSYLSYKNNIVKHTKKLLPYCEFEVVFGGIQVSEIYESVYDKGSVRKDKELILREITLCLSEQEGLASISGMARKFVKLGQYSSFMTARRHLTLAANELFGKTDGLISHGEAGNREYIWGIKVDDYNHYRMLTEKEEEIFNNLISSVYASEPEQIKKTALLEEALRRKEIDVDEYFNQKDKLGLNTFVDCIFKFRELTGETIVRCTKHELMESYDFIENKEA